MGQKIAISQAARDLGVPRADLTKRLAAAGIEAFEGQVDFEKLQCIAPSLGRGNPILERIKVLRENTVGSVAIDEQILTERSLHDQVRRLSTELMVESSLNHKYEQIFQAISQKLGEYQTAADGEARDLAFEMCAWLRAKITEGD